MSIEQAVQTVLETRQGVAFYHKESASFCAVFPFHGGSYEAVTGFGSYDEALRFIAEEQE
jgi:hypothetical protein